jgi:hypothetical protein
MVWVSLVIGYQKIWRCRWLFYPNQLVLISVWLIHLTAAYVVIFGCSRGRRNREPSNCRVVSEALTSEHPSRHPPFAWSPLAWSTVPWCSVAGKHPGRAETRRIDVAAADISECIGKDHNGHTVRRRYRYVSSTERSSRASADKNRSERANELGSQRLRPPVHLSGPFVHICSGGVQRRRTAK